MLTNRVHKSMKDNNGVLLCAGRKTVCTHLRQMNNNSSQNRPSAHSGKYYGLNGLKNNAENT